MSKITAYAVLSSVQSDDVIPIVDVHDVSMAGSGTTKHVTVSALLANTDAAGAAATAQANAKAYTDAETARAEAAEAALLTGVAPVALGTAAVGTATQAARQDHIHPTTGLLTKVADTGTSGYTLANSTPVIISWTAPNDGNLHYVSWGMYLSVTSAETGGNIITSIQGLYSIGNGFGGGLAVGNYVAGTNTVVPPGSTFQIKQSVALTAGASVLSAQIWAA